MRRLETCAAALAAALLLAGCASATRGWSEQIAIASTPSGAIAKVVGPEVPIECVTPCAVQIRRADDVSVEFTLAGYEPQVVPLYKELATGGAAGFAGNLLLGGVVGMAVDGVSNAALDHKPNPVTVILKPLPRSTPAPTLRRPPARRPPVPQS